MAFILPAARRRPRTLGVNNGRLAACPNSPNCVSSQALRPDARVEPFGFRGDPARAFASLIEVVRAHPKAELVTAGDDYLHAEFRAMFFIDDFEAYLPAGAQHIEVRSASRIGHSDLGANARRVEALRAAFSSRQ